MEPIEKIIKDCTTLAPEVRVMNKCRKLLYSIPAARDNGYLYTTIEGGTLTNRDMVMGKIADLLTAISLYQTYLSELPTED